MAASPVKFLFGFLMLSITLWMLFIFASRLVAWVLSRVLGSSVSFRVGGWKCLRDVVVKFKKGAVESICIGEVKLSLRQSLVKLGVGFISRDPKLQVVICDIEVVLRPSNKSKRKSKNRKARSSGRGKWMVVANIARFLSISVTDLVVKLPKATAEVKLLSVDIFKDVGSKPDLLVKLHIIPVVVHIGDSRVSCDQSTCVSSGQTSCTMIESSLSALSCEKIFLTCEFGHDREVGVVIRDVDMTCGEVIVNLNEEMHVNNKTSSEGFLYTDKATRLAPDSSVSENPNYKHEGIEALSKYSSFLPEKVSFNLPRLDVRFVHRELNLAVENNIMGIQLKSIKSRSAEDVGESTRLDVQVDFSEIHLLREVGRSALEILKVNVIVSVYIPIQPTLPIRAEIDVKLGGTQCNIIISRLEPWLNFQSSKTKKMVLGKDTPSSGSQELTDFKAIMWTCTMSAPEMIIMLYSMSGLPLYHGCSQSSHVFANNISTAGTAVHMELGELNLDMIDEHHESFQESIFGVQSNSGSLLNIAKLSLDWGKKDTELLEDCNNDKCKLVLFVDVTGMGVYFTIKRIESLIVTVTSFQYLLKNLSVSGKGTAQRHGGRTTKSSGKGTQLMKVNLERCSVSFCGDTGLDNAVVLDPKRVNYGSQGGCTVINVSADGSNRRASIKPSISSEIKRLKYSVSLDIFHFSLCVNKVKKSTQMELERARSIYHEYLEEYKPSTKLTLFDMQNAKFVRRSGGLKNIAVCSLFSATDIAVKWEPDVHICLFELVLHLKLLIHSQKLHEDSKIYTGDVSGVTDSEKMKEATVESGNLDKHKEETLFAVDVEMLSISAEVGDGVEATLQVQSIFSENARIGVLLEGLMLSFNGSRILKSSRMQISRVPNASSGSPDLKSSVPVTLDWVIQGLDIHICMPYRLQMRAIDDSVEDMFRGLKLITTAKKNLILPMKKDSPGPKKSSSTKFGRVKFCIRKLTVDIEEEPMQGWLDEHCHLLKKEASELAVRLNFVDELISRSSEYPKTKANDSSHQNKLNLNGVDIDIQDPSAVEKLREEIYKQSFRSYYLACQKLDLSEGSGACREGFQAGFRPSAKRNSLLSVCATELEVVLTKVDGGDDGMIEIIRKLDPISLEHNIPFSRLYGSNIFLQTNTLAVQLRDFTFPLFLGTSGKCDGRVVLAQQATCFQPQIYQDVCVGKWRMVRMLRSESGTTPPVKTYSDLPIHFWKAEISFGVGYEPAFADISYAFTIALRRANLSVRNSAPQVQLPKKERSLPWWDDMRNYIHGNVSLFVSESRWILLATTDPYEKHDKLQIVSASMELHQSDGRVYVSAKEFKILISSLESLAIRRGLQLPAGASGALIEAPAFSLEVTMVWECDSGSPLNHYLFALPVEGKPREKVFDPFRSTSLSLRWNLCLRPSLPLGQNQSMSSLVRESTIVDATVYDPPFRADNVLVSSPTLNIGAHDLAWLLKFWSMNYLPPHKLRAFSRWPRYKVARAVRSGNLSMDKVMTEFMFRIDAMPACIKHMPLDDDDPAKGLTFNMTKLKYELCYSRGKQKYTFECKRDPLDLVYQGLDLHMPKVFLNKEGSTSVAKVVQVTRKTSQSASMDRVPSGKSGCREKNRDDGFLLSSDYFTIRRQAPKADPARLLAWQEAGRRNLEMTYVRSEFENGSDSDEHARSDPSDDDGYNVVIADNCQRVFIYGLRLLWTVENRDAIWSWVGGISKALEPQKPSPSRQYAQRKLVEELGHAGGKVFQNDTPKPPSTNHGANSPSQHANWSGSPLSPAHSVKEENAFTYAAAKNGGADDCKEEEGTRHFMVNVIEPQFNFHSEEANGRFLLAAVSGRVLARSFHSVLHVGYEMIEQVLCTKSVHIPESAPEMTWKRMEFSVMLEHVQAHVAPTDVDPGAGLQWLPKIRRSSPKVKRTGALLERVFMPCDMYFRYTRHKGGTQDLKVKPLKELTFNSHNITATMTSRQFQVMLDVLTNLLFARLPKPRKNILSYPAEDDEDVEEEEYEVIPDGVEEVELAKIHLERKEREQKVLLDDIKKLSLQCDALGGDLYSGREGDLWMLTGGLSILVRGLRKELASAKMSRKEASASLRMALHKAAQQRLMEKEKNKSPSYAMRISLQINKVVWSMLVDGKSFAEAEINDMIFDFDRDYKDIGVSQFTTKYFVVRNCLPNAKSDMLLSAWDPPSEWGKKFMLRVDAKQGSPKDGNSPLELFQVEIYPLKIHLTETMYRMMWEYFFPEEEQDSQRRQEVWLVSTTGLRRVKKGSAVHEASASATHSTKESEAQTKLSASVLPSASINADSTAAPFSKGTTICSSTPELRRTCSLERAWEETVAETVANELVVQAHSSTGSLKPGAAGFIEQSDESSKGRVKDSKPTKSGRSSHEEKKAGKSHEEKRSRPRKVMEFHNIKISQVKLLVTYEGSRFVVNDLKLLMDTFQCLEFTGTWRRLFSRVKKHIIWGVLKSVTGMQGKKLKDKAHSQRDLTGTSVPDSDLNLSDNEGGLVGKADQHPITWLKRPSDGAGDGFVTSIRGLFNTQRRKAKAFVLRTMRGEVENDYHGEWSESDGEFSPFARQLTITKAKRLIRRHTKKFRSRGHKGSSSQQRESLPSSPREMASFGSDSSDESSPYEDFHE